MAKSDILTGSSVFVRINQSTVGLINSISLSVQQGARYTIGIDSILPQEISITGPFLVSGAISGFRTRSSGGLSGLSLFPSGKVEEIFNQRYNMIEIVDRRTNNVLYTIRKVVFTNKDISFASGGAVVFSASFQGILYQSEAAG